MTVAVGKPVSYQDIFEQHALYRSGKLGSEEILRTAKSTARFARECPNCGAPNQTIDYPCRYCWERVQP